MTTRREVRVRQLMVWLRTADLSPANRLQHTTDLEELLRERDLLVRLSRAARRLDAALAEFGTNPAYVSDLAEALHGVLIEIPLVDQQEGETP